MLAYRVAEERAARDRVRAAHGALRLARARLAQARREIAHGEPPAGGGRPERAVGLLRRQHYRAWLHARMLAAEAEVRRAEGTLAAAEAQLTAAGRDRLAVEKLVTIRREEASRREAAELQREIDDRGRAPRITGGW